MGLTPRAEQTPPIIPAGTYALTPSSQFESSESLWAITPEGVWFTRSAPNETFSWTRCISLDQPVTHLKVNDTGALLVSPERLVFISPDCQRVKVFSPPLSEGVIFMDAEWWGNRLYGATSGGLFVWEDESDLSISKAGVRYLKRDLALFPRILYCLSSCVDRARSRSSSRRIWSSSCLKCSTSSGHSQIYNTTLSATISDRPSLQGVVSSHCYSQDQSIRCFLSGVSLSIS